MALSFKDLKNTNSDLERLQAEASKLDNKYSNDDEGYWYPELDKTDSSYCVIRFLPASAGEDVPFVRMFSHGFKGPTGSWYVENSLTTIGKQDPVGEHNAELWNSGIEANKEIARKQKRKLSYISNIYVIKDSVNPENEGKVFLFRYGKKIWDKINEAMNPKFEDESPMNPFDFWKGANFKMKICKVEGYRNYDRSEFDKPSPLFNDDEKIETVWNQQKSLAALIAEDKFRPYDELKAKMNKVLGLAGKKAAHVKAAAEPTEDASFDTPTEDEEEDDGGKLDWFKKLAEDKD